MISQSVTDGIAIYIIYRFFSIKQKLEIIWRIFCQFACLRSLQDFNDVHAYFLDFADSHRNLDFMNVQKMNQIAPNDRLRTFSDICSRLVYIFRKPKLQGKLIVYI